MLVACGVGASGAGSGGDAEGIAHTISQPLVSSSFICSDGELWLTAARELLSQLKSSEKLTSWVFLGGRPGGAKFSIMKS